MVLGVPIFKHFRAEFFQRLVSSVTRQTHTNGDQSEHMLKVHIVMTAAHLFKTKDIAR